MFRRGHCCDLLSGPSPWIRQKDKSNQFTGRRRTNSISENFFGLHVYYSCYPVAFCSCFRTNKPSTGWGMAGEVSTSHFLYYFVLRFYSSVLFLFHPLFSCHPYPLYCQLHTHPSLTWQARIALCLVFGIILSRSV